LYKIVVFEEAKIF